MINGGVGEQLQVGGLPCAEQDLLARHIYATCKIFLHVAYTACKKISHLKKILLQTEYHWGDDGTVQRARVRPRRHAARRNGWSGHRWTFARWSNSSASRRRATSRNWCSKQRRTFSEEQSQTRLSTQWTRWLDRDNLTFVNVVIVPEGCRRIWLFISNHRTSHQASGRLQPGIFKTYICCHFIYFLIL